MGFYGNITNTNKTQFTFDRTYPNRKTMDMRLANDDIYLGRYVLVEYDTDGAHTLDTYLQCYVMDGEQGEQFYTTPQCDELSRVKWSAPDNSGNPTKPNTVTTGQLIYVNKDLTPNNNTNILSQVFYKCINNSDARDGDIAIFQLIAASESNYTKNYKIDTATYGEGRGYDSTVWQKVYSQGAEKYVMIAELNSVVPTFDLTADAPTMTPITPHFDADSTNVYYKLHWQPQWGLRVSAKEDLPSDSSTIWVKETYDPATDIKTKMFYNYVRNEWMPYVTLSSVINNAEAHVPAAIHYNAAAFNAQVNPERTSATGIAKHVEDTNYFTILPTGKSGNEYNTHDGTGNKTQQEDVQEMRINLPAIGNMMSDAWDIIHGPYRNNDMREVDESGNRVDSLKGRLNSIAAINGNEIPVKRLSDGKLVGTRINGDNNHLEDEISEILSEELTTSLTTDDAWIYTKIDSNAIDDEHNDGIAIHHTFHATENSESSINKNDGEITKSAEYKADDILAENLSADKDVLHLYTPYVDAAGHVVGKNIETVTLPYSYRTYETSGLNETSDADIYTTIQNDDNGANTSSATANKTTTVASETQDTITINPGNKWIQTKFEDDSLTIAHEIHAVDTVAQTTNLNSDNVASSNATDKITIQDTVYDMAGHVIQNRAHTYTLPYGFKTIKTNGRSTEVAKNATSDPVTDNVVAENTQDILTIDSGNKWIRIDTDASGDSITIRHDVHDTSLTEDITDWTKTEANTTIPTVTYEYDEAGHYVSHHTENYKLPFGYGQIKGDNDSSTAATATYDEVTFASDDWLTATVTKDTVTYSHDYPNKEADTESESDVNGNGDTIVLETLERDETGHVTKVNQNTVTLPYGFKTITTNGRGNNNDNINTGDDVNTANVVADNTQDTLAINSGNKWIRIDANTNNDSLTIAHDIHSITETVKNKSNLDGGNGEFTVQDLAFDAAGHVTANQAHTYNLPNAIRNIKIGNNSTVAAGSTPTQAEGQSDEEFNASLRVDATAYNDTLNLNAQNRWVTLNRDKNNKTITIGHAAAGNEKTTAGDTTDIGTLQFGDSFTVPYVKYDEMGHISASGTRSITLQKPSMDDVEATEARVLTGIAMTDETGAITTAYSNVGTLKLTDYSAKDGAGATYVASADTINAAFRKVDDRLDQEIADARAAEQQVLSDAKAYTDAAKKEILTGDATETVAQAYDTLLEIATWIEGDGVNATELTKAIADEAKIRDEEDKKLQAQFTKLNISEDGSKVAQAALSDNSTSLGGKAAVDYLLKTEASEAYQPKGEYATKAQGDKADSAIQADTKFTYQETKDDETTETLFDGTIDDLIKEVISLKKQLVELTAKVNEAHPVEKEETPPAAGDDNSTPSN